MQQKVTPAMIIVAIVVLVILVAAIWYFTMGKAKKTSTEEAPPAGQTMQPTSPDAAAKMGIKKGTGVAPATP